MTLIISTFFVFGLALCFHIFLWRVRTPQAQRRALVLVFFAFWISFCILINYNKDEYFYLFKNSKGLEISYFTLIYWAAALCYIITFSAMEGDSPTLSLTRHLYRVGEKGVSSKEIEEFFRQRPFIGARVRALVSDRILIEESGGYRLRSGKYLFFHTILFYRRMVFGAVGSGG